MKLGAWLALVALAGLAIGNARPAPGGGFALVALCGDAAHPVRIPLKPGDDQQHDGAAGCHALCSRRKTGDAA